MDSRNFAIGVLSTTAVILLVGLFVIHSRPEVAMASGMTAKGGTYLLTVGMDPSGDQELLYVINTPAERMIVYRFDPNRGAIELAEGVELSEIRKANQPQKTQNPRKRGSRSRGRRP